LADNLDGTIRRTAVYDNVLNIGVGLGCHRREGLAKTFGVVVVDSYD
jgi:hypothetical protein